MTLKTKKRLCAFLVALTTILSFFTISLSSYAARIDPVGGTITIQPLWLLYVEDGQQKTEILTNDVTISFTPVSYDNTYVEYQMEVVVPKYVVFTDSNGASCRLYFDGDLTDVQLHVLNSTPTRDCSLPSSAQITTYLSDYWKITFQARAGAGGQWLTDPTASWDYLAEKCFDNYTSESITDSAHIEIQVVISDITLQEVSTQIQGTNHRLDDIQEIIDQMKEEMVVPIDDPVVPDDQAINNAQQVLQNLTEALDRVAFPQLTSQQKQSGLAAISDAGHTLSNMISNANIAPISYLIQGIYNLPIVGPIILIMTIAALLMVMLKRGED